MVVAASTGCAGSGGSGGDSSPASGDEQDLTAANKAVLSAVEADVHQHAQNHVVTKEQDALSALVSGQSAQDGVKKAITDNTPDGAANPFFGNVTVAGKKYIWADFETDEGEGPAASGKTFVFDDSGKKILFRSWSGSHDFT
jgi:hypothetical protein